VQRQGGQALMGTILYLMCDDLRGLMKSLRARKIKCAKVGKASWGSFTSILLPSGGEIGLYQPTHPTAHGV